MISCDADIAQQFVQEPLTAEAPLMIAMTKNIRRPW